MPLLGAMSSRLLELHYILYSFCIILNKYDRFKKLEHNINHRHFVNHCINHPCTVPPNTVPPKFCTNIHYPFLILQSVLGIILSPLYRSIELIFSQKHGIGFFFIIVFMFYISIARQMFKFGRHLLRIEFMTTNLKY